LSLLSGAYGLSDAGSPAHFHSETNGYSVAIPEGWRVVPEETSRRLFGPGLAESNLSFDLEAVLAIEFTENGMAYPYAIVQVKKYVKYGVSQPLNKDEIQEIFDTLTKAVSKLGHASNMVTHLPENMQKIVSEIRSGQIYLDKGNVSLLQGTDMGIPGVGKVKQVSLWRCGRQAVVKMTFICTESDWDRFARERNLVLDSLQFDTTNDYKGAPSALVTYGRKAKGGGSSWEGILVDVAVYGIIGGVVFVIGLIAHAVRKMKTKPMEETEPSPQPEAHDDSD